MAAILPLLKQVVPVLEVPPFPENALVVTVDGQTVAVDAEALAPREIALIKALLPQAQSQHPWARFLRGAGLAPSAQPVRLLHFAVDFTASSLPPAAWLTAFTSLFTVPVTGFFDTETAGTLIEPAEARQTDAGVLLGILDTLDSDFDTTTRLFVGHPWPVNGQLPAIAAAEQKLALGATARLATIPDTALTASTQALRTRDPLLKALAATIAAQPESLPIIGALYQAQGNLTAAAKALYMHRNTLQYRLEKFEATTGFNLRRMDDLVLCHLLTTR
ncbi:helix-turn-helix domain-containing protein [Lacticaseibacillus daqingensis]|uniref:helix-turn-helix domain-containing protein n=1 Tax=Lacticaseibacillus daqingensis TaxID=2486014 RepID=UPI000F7AE56C|nr:helix-turn-helix domain-containing protein [Lacticaseibacillus daqingensis]